MDKFKLAGRALAQLDYEAFSSIMQDVIPMLEDKSHIEAIYASVQTEFASEEDYMRKVLFVATIYDCYCPGSFFAKSIMKMPAGIRDEVSKCMGYENPEMVNYFVDRAKPFLKFREKSFGQKVAHIKEMFKQYSLNPLDWELKLA